MKAVILYRSQSDHERSVNDYMHDFEHQTGKTIEALDVEQQEGQELAQLYDIMQYPAVIARAEDGSLIKVWSDGQLPLMNELSYFIKGD
ncbi:hypothetical protein DYH10_02010 [Candidatus Saccharibacteria bacterium CPR2]|nr:hypothetical protein [Candidatus Saccharibacteria bacterium CPR2]